MDESYLSWLRLIPGVSADLARRIAERYPDPELLKGATPEDLARVPGMTEDVAGRVLDLVRAASTADASWYREEPALYLCPECGSFVGKGTNACPFCGVVFDEGEPAAPPQSPVEELLQARNGEAKICTRCGAFLEPGTTACRMCGSEYGAERVAELPAVDTTPLPDPDRFLCPHCGAFLSHADVACAICGSPVDAEAKIPGLAREGKGVSKDFLSRWQRAASEEIPIAPAPVAPRTIEDELAEYERILEADPSLERAWVHKGRLLARLGRAQDAIACFDRAARIDPENEDVYRLEALGLLGRAPDLSVLPPRWKEAEPPAPFDDLLDLEEPPRAPPAPAPAAPAKVAPAVAPASERTSGAKVAPKPARVPEPPASRALPQEAAAIRRALTYYDRLLAMDSGLRVAWQTKGELLLRMGRDADAEDCFQRAADLEVAEREFGRAALTGLQTRGPVRPVPARGTRPAGRTNGRVNGLTNGRRGMTNGRVNGLTNGSGATNGLTNGLGRVNGLMSGLARGEGRTNGLVNGNGFTNGQRGRAPAPLPSAGREWARSLAGIAAVVLLMVLAPILASMFTTTPAATGIAIDGSFGDWGRVALLHADPFTDQAGNPDVNLVGYKVFSDIGTLALYARVEGTAFRGADDGADILVALVDADGDPSNGYDAGAIGAEYAVEIVGWDSGVRDARLLRFQSGADRTDWFGFEPIGSARAVASGSEVELASDIDTTAETRILLFAVDGAGRWDAGDAVVAPALPALVARETTVAPEVITTQTRVAVLRIDLEPSSVAVSVTAINVTKLGSVADAVVTLSLYRDDGDGVFDLSDPLVASAPLSQGRASFPAAVSLSTPITYFVAADFALLPANATVGVALEGIESDGTVSTVSRALTLSYLATTPTPTVDGAFGDWAAVVRSVDPIGDVRNRTGIALLQNGNVDLTEIASVLSGNATFYLRVDGQVLGGVDVPNVRARVAPSGAVDSDFDTVPDLVELGLGTDLARDFDNDNVTDANEGGDVDSDGVDDFPLGADLYLNTTIPAWYPAPYAGFAVARYIGPIAPRVLEGVDSAIAYVDGDNSSATGLVTTVGLTTYGLDWALVAVGRHGRVLTADAYRYRAGPRVPWEFAAPIAAAVDSARMELSAPNALLNLSVDYRTVYYAADWTLSADYGVPTPPGRSPSPPPETRSPAGDNVVINEISPKPNPEWVEVVNPTPSSISLAGWTLQRRQGNSWTTIFTFTSQVLGAWGSGTEYLATDLPPNSLPNGQSTVRLQDGLGKVVDVTMSPPTRAGDTWSRFKDPLTGKPMDSDNDGADFYNSLAPSEGGPNDRHRPTIAVGKTVSQATAAPGDLVTYTLYYNNTNSGRANHVWVNDTLPAQVTFVGSSVPYTSSAGQTYRWHFTNVAPMSNDQFTVAVRVNDGVGDGDRLVNRADLEYTDQLNRKLPGSSGWGNVTVSRPEITVKKVGTPSVALPGDTIVYTIFYNNTGSASAQHVWINDTLSPDVTFVSSSVPYNSSSGQTYRWHFTNVAPGPHGFTITVTVNLNATSSELVNWVFLNYTTQNGWKLEESGSSVTIPIPEFSDLAVAAVVPMIVFAVRRWRRRAQDRANG